MLADIDWASLLLAAVFMLAGITTWIWGHHAGVNRGRELERDLIAQREEERRRHQHGKGDI